MHFNIFKMRLEVALLAAVTASSTGVEFKLYQTS